MAIFHNSTLKYIIHSNVHVWMKTISIWYLAFMSLICVCDPFQVSASYMACLSPRWGMHNGYMLGGYMCGCFHLQHGDIVLWFYYRRNEWHAYAWTGWWLRFLFLLLFWLERKVYVLVSFDYLVMFIWTLSGIKDECHALSAWSVYPIGHPLLLKDVIFFFKKTKKKKPW